MKLYAGVLLQSQDMKLQAYVIIDLAIELYISVPKFNDNTTRAPYKRSRRMVISLSVTFEGTYFALKKKQ
jgi:hypothetical protein